MVSSDEPPSRALIVFFDVIAILLISLLLLVVFTAALSHQVQRRLSWYNFMIPVILYQASFLLLLGSQNRSQPPASICVFQALLVYTLPVYCTIGFASFMLDSYFLLKKVFDGVQPSKAIRRLLLGIPPATFFMVLVTDLVFILTQAEIKSSIKPHISGLYCRSDASTTPLLIAVTISGIGFCVWFFVYIRIALMLRLKWRKAGEVKYEESLHRDTVLSLFVRTTFTTLGTCIGLGLGLHVAIALSTDGDPYAILQYLGFPLLVLLAFGTQADFFRCWVCRGRSKPLPAPEQL